MWRIVHIIDALNRRIGRGVAWAALAMVLVQFAVVMLRHVFSVGYVAMQEAVWYLHGILFMVGAGYTLLEDGHVRVDVFYRDARPATRALIDLIGAAFLLVPVCVVIIWLSRAYVLNAVLVLETGGDPAGLPLVFALKAVIWLFALLVGLQGVSMALKAWGFLSGMAPHYPPRPGR